MQKFSLNEIKKISPEFFSYPLSYQFGDISYTVYRGFLLIKQEKGWAVYAPETGYGYRRPGFDLIDSRLRNREEARRLCLKTLEKWNENKCEE
jgi:ectoine hydroxylase-related dioxygenase (phytanoyl-CoA dioxygenase family)